MRDKVEQDKWLAAYLRELEYFKNRLGDRIVTSIFFGGGTPSLMNPELVGGIIDKVGGLWNVDKKAEITLEANPTSIEAAKFRDFKKAGVNRVSIGIQALNDKDLKFLGREHSSVEALSALEIARQNFDNFSFDLIYARPEQTVKEWEEELKKALSFSAPHMSLYQLTIEKGTPFYAAHSNKEFSIPEQDIAADMYSSTSRIMESAGMPSYEISNYAKLGMESRHNMSYWRYDEYAGIGPGAHSRVAAKNGREALMMIHNPEAWLNSVMEKGDGIQQAEEIVGEKLLSEIIMMGLRVKEGINKSRFRYIYGEDFASAVDKDGLSMLMENGFVEENNKSFRATSKGQILLGAVVEKLLYF